ncbi:MAG TPA: sulfatase-like hydrolase/transferase [Solirubrobacteraceae bacterium]|nr:sulfatase-like hydrolase/transferase [Solirubrobacteraceae bacterium]
MEGQPHSRPAHQAFGLPERPNLVLVITDQQRATQHWPEDPSWLRELCPHEAELRAHALSFSHAFTATAMCSPSRACLMTGKRPSRHGVTLTLTEGDLWPDRRNAPAALRTALREGASGEIPRGRLARSFVRTALRLGPRSGHEPELPPGIDTLATLLRDRGYHVAMKGKWHLSKPVDGEHWGAADPQRLERDYGFGDWEPPDAGGDTKAHNFGGGNAGSSREGWDEDYTRQMESWLSRAGLPEPFCLVFSLVNPHDVLGYPGSYLPGGYEVDEFRGLGVPLPATIDEDLREKPAVQALSRLGMDNYLGPLADLQAKQDYVDFYAYLHRVVDRHLGRLLRALGPADDETSLRSRTIVIRTSDHGEMGLSHGGLRQKIFNAYEETIRVPLVISNPRLFPQPRESDALVSLLDIVPTCLGIAGPGKRPQSLDGEDLSPLIYARAPAIRDAVLFTYDDHQAGTALQNASGQPNRVRCVRDERFKYAVYLDPDGRARPEYELYDLHDDPLEARNLLGVRGGDARERRQEELRERMAERLAELCTESGTLSPPL